MWADIDVKTDAAATLEEATTIAHLVAPPSLVVHSGHGVQGWWLLDRPWVFKSYTEQAAAATLALRWGRELRDQALTHHVARLDSVHDLARLMRAPGTVNCKQTPVPVTVALQTGRRYHRDELEHLVAHRSELIEKVGSTAPAGDVAIGGAPWAPMGEALKARLSMFAAQRPEFKDAWEHTYQDVNGWSQSEWDLSIANLLAQAVGFSNQEIAQVVAAGRRRFKGQGDPKARRHRYLEMTVQIARASADARQAKEPVDEGLAALLGAGS
jgi:hypothetical protein